MEGIKTWNGVSVHRFWIGLKRRIVARFKRYTAKLARQKRMERENIVKQIVALRRKVKRGEDHDEALTCLDGSLRALTEWENEGAKIRSSVQWLEEGKKAYALFFLIVCGA